MKRILISTAVVMFIASACMAQKTEPSIKKTQQHQEKRIDKGVKSGALTKKEAAHLHHQQAEIQHHKKVAKSDGVVTPREKAKIKHKQKHASKSIHKQKHDAQHKVK